MSDHTRDIAQFCEGDYPTSTIVCLHGVAVVPHGSFCELPAAFARAALEYGRALLLTKWDRDEF